MAYGLIVQVSLLSPTEFLLLGLGISNVKNEDYNSSHIFVNISLYGPPASILPSPLYFTSKTLS